MMIEYENIPCSEDTKVVKTETLRTRGDLFDVALAFSDTHQTRTGVFDILSGGAKDGGSLEN